MSQSLRLVVRAALWIAGVYGLLWLVASIWVGGPAATIDTYRAQADIYKSDVREFLYRLPAFCRDAAGQKNLLLIGGSTGGAYDPAIIGGFAKGWSTSRISIDFGNVTQMRQSIALLRQCMDKQSFASARFVVGVSFVSMASDAKNFPTPYTMIELEQMRHGLFTGAPRRLKPAVPWDRMETVIDIGRPVILAHYLATSSSDGIADARLRLGTLRQGAKPDVDQATREARDVALYSETVPAPVRTGIAEQAAELAALVADVRAGGADVALISIPEKSFVRRDIAGVATYRAWLARFARDHDVALLHHPASDADFRDGAHADDAGSARWSRDIGPAVADFLAAG